MQLDQNLHEISKGRIFSGIDSIQYVIVIYEFILKTKHCRPWAKTGNAQPYWKSVVHLAPADSLKPSNLTADDGGSWNLFKQKFISVITLPTQWPHTRISAGTAILLSRMHTWKSMASSEDTVPTPSRSSTIKHPRHLAVDTVTLDPVITSIMNSFSVVSCGVFQKKKKERITRVAVGISVNTTRTFVQCSVADFLWLYFSKKKKSQWNSSDHSIFFPGESRSCFRKQK